jgi:hypothetical protein
MEPAEAEAIYDSGRERCVEVILELARTAELLAARCEKLTARCERLEERVRRLEEQDRSGSRNSSKPPSEDPPKSRQQRRAEARAKAKELFAAEGGQRKAGAQPGHRGSGRKLKPCERVDEIAEHYPEACSGCGHRFTEDERARATTSAAIRSPSCRRPRWSRASIAPTGCAAQTAAGRRRPSCRRSFVARRSAAACRRRS